MQKREKTDLIFKALSAAQGEFVTLKKDKKGVHNSTFADLSSFLDMVRPVFSRHNLFLAQPVKYEDNMIVISTFIGHASGQFLQSEELKMPALQNANKAHGIAGSVTYARRYSLQSMLGIAAEDEDTDGAAENNQNYQKKSQPNVNRTKKIQNNNDKIPAEFEIQKPF
ncbi:hypothetical protein CMK18_22285 [Candidatus Poribacteria bacterium]|nr:hypothetical protein [Candidatus Poribacteria bacterium]